MLGNTTKVGLNRVVDRWETRRWRRELDTKTTLRLYRNKVDIGEEGIYRNTYGTVLMFRCRTNTLGLRWKNQFSGEAVDCLLCGALCGGVWWSEGDKRERYGVDADIGVEEVLLFEGRSEEGLERYTRMLDEMWKERRRLMDLMRRAVP